MTARRNRNKRAVTEEMANEVLAEDVIADESEGVAHDPEGMMRRPFEEVEGKGLMHRIEQGARVAASVGVAAAALLGWYEYRQVNNEVLRERSVEIVENWQSSGQIDRFARLQRFVEVKLGENEKLDPDMPEDLLAGIYRTLGKNWMEDIRQELKMAKEPGANSDPEAIEALTQVEEDVDRLTLFFGDMETCISADLCEEKILHDFFSTEVGSFWQYFQGYALLRRQEYYPDYGKPVDALVARFDKRSAKATATQ